MANGIVLNIDTTKSEFQNPMVQLRQGDGNYQSLSVIVTSNGEPFDLTGWTITFMGTTAGGFKIVDTASVVTNASQGEFTYTPTKAWGQDEGEFKNAYFKFTKADETASGASFRVNVLDAVDLTAEEAGDYISIVDQTINKLNGDLSTLQTSVDQLKAQNNNIKTSDNTWTGTNTFNQQIFGSFKTRRVTFTDLADVAKDSVKYSGIWYKSIDDTIANSPIDVEYAIIEVVVGDNSGSGKIIFTPFSGGNVGKIYYNVFYGRELFSWHQFADDATVVHNTGTETVAGDKTLTGSATFTQPIDARVKERGTLYGVVDALSMIKTAANNSGFWRLSGVTLVGSGQDYNGSIWGTLLVYPWGDGSGASLILNAVSGISNHPSQLITGGDSTSTSLTWYKLADDANVVHNTGTETVSGNKTLTGKTSLSGGFTFNLTDLGAYNADSITQSGSYSSNGTLTGLPVTPAYGVLVVESNATDTKQTFTQTNIDRPVSWTRVKNNNIGGWSNWVLTFGYSDLNISEVSNDPALIDLSTDKTMYAPYEGVTFNGYPNASSGKINIEYWKREQKVGTQTVRFSSSEVTWKWYLPSDDNEQYIAKIVVTTDGGRTSTQYYAINVATNSNNLPIMGFLSIYTTHDTKAQRSVMNWLKRTHMNYIQYYDAYYRPENFLAVDDSAFREGIDTNNPQGIGVAGTASDYWSDLSRHAVRKDVLQKYVELGHEYGMKNMFYIPWGNTSYVDTDHGITPEMLLFPTVADATAHNVNSVPATLTGGEGQWARYSLMKANPSSSAFKNMLFTSAKKALQAIGFDGLHIDTLGPNYGGVYTIDGAEYSNDFAASNGMPDFVNDAATFFNTDSWMKQGQNIRMSFNNVGSWGISALANNQNIDYLYAEQWPDMGNRTYNDMFNHVKDIVTSDTRGRAVIPAYIHKGYTGTGNFDDNGVIMLDLVIMAAGGTHLELGEHMLRSEYFPDVGLGLSDYLKNWLVQYYDFLVAYRRMFTSQNFTNTITSSSHAISVNSIDVNKLSVIEKTDDYIQSLSLINTNGLNGSEWQDNQLNRNKPSALSNVNLKFNFTPKAVYYVTIENPIPQALNVTNNAVTVPSVDRYSMVYAYK